MGRTDRCICAKCWSEWYGSPDQCPGCTKSSKSSVMNIDDAIVDILFGLIRYCADRNLNFDDILRQARYNYEKEKE